MEQEGAAEWNVEPLVLLLPPLERSVRSRCARVGKVAKWINVGLSSSSRHQSNRTHAKID